MRWEDGWISRVKGPVGQSYSYALVGGPWSLGIEIGAIGTSIVRATA